MIMIVGAWTAVESHVTGTGTRTQHKRSLDYHLSSIPKSKLSPHLLLIDWTMPLSIGEN